MQAKAAKQAEKIDRQRAQKDVRIFNGPKFSDIVNVSEKKEHGMVSKQSSVVGRKKKNVAFKTDDIDIDADIERRNKPKLIFSSSNRIQSSVSDDGGTSSPDNPSRQASDTHSSDDANSDVLQTVDSGIGEDLPDSSNFSIFDRPGFGTVAFRNSTGNLSAVNQENNSTHEGDRNVLNTLKSHLQQGSKSSYSQVWAHHMQERLKDGGTFVKNNCSTICDSIGSASSLARRHITWEDECDFDDADDDATDEDDISDDEDEYDGGEPLSLFLTTVGLSEYIPLFQSEQIDLESLSLLSEDDFKALRMPLGPRRKLENAIQQRLKTLREPGIVQDSHL